MLYKVIQPTSIIAWEHRYCYRHEYVDAGHTCKFVDLQPGDVVYILREKVGRHERYDCGLTSDLRLVPLFASLSWGDDDLRDEFLERV